MAATYGFLSLEQFEALYREQKPHVEYWFGEAVPKNMPTSLHGVYQWILAMLLAQRGWKAATEVRLKLSALAHPVPDVIADSRRIQLPYPTEPFDLCIEIISPGDDRRKVFQKAAHYLDWGIGSVWIIDPEQRKAFSMSRDSAVPVELDSTGTLTAGSNCTLPLEDLFREVDKILSA